MKAYCLVVLQSGNPHQINSKVRRKASDIDTVTRAESITGPYDLLVSIEVDSLAQLKDTFLSVQSLDGVERSIPCVVLDG